MRSCEYCGKPLESKRAKYCPGSKCRSMAHKRRTSGVVVALHPQGPDAPAPTGGSVVAVTTKQLEEAGRLDTYLGAAALVAAARLDETADTGSAVAALLREFRVAMAEALAGQQHADGLDEVRQARERRLAGL